MAIDDSIHRFGHRTKIGALHAHQRVKSCIDVVVCGIGGRDAAADLSKVTKQLRALRRRRS